MATEAKLVLASTLAQPTDEIISSLAVAADYHTVGLDDSLMFTFKDGSRVLVERRPDSSTFTLYGE